MIRGVDITLDPSIKYAGLQEEESGLKASLRYLESLGFSLNNLSKGCHLAGRITELKVVSQMGQIVAPLSRASQLANLFITTETLLSLMQEGKLGLDLPSVKEVLILAGKGIELSTWLARVEKLGIPLRAISALTSMGLAIALISPMISLIIQLREEGWGAFSGTEGYKTSYKLGMVLLAVYLFSATITLSAYLEVAMLGTNFALSYL